MAAGAVLVFGAALRVFDLGNAPYSHDEAIHANFSLALGDYHYDPVYHGPLLYHLTALVFWAVGAHDFSARLAPALLGIALLALALGPARRWIGERGALWSASLLAISPVTVAYSRRLLHDTPVLALSLGAVLCFQVARGTRSYTRAGRRARLGVAALLSLLLATKANALFIMTMLAALWLADALRRAPGVESSVATAKPSVTSWPWWVPALALSAVTVASVMAVREPPNVREANERMLTIVCLLALAAVWEWLRRAPEDFRSEAWRAQLDAAPNDKAAPTKAPDVTKASGVARSNDAGETFTKTPITAAPSPSSWDWKTPLLSLVVAVSIFAFFYGRGVLWWRDPLHIAALYGGDIVGPESAIPRMLRYWGGQQGQPRLPGRHDYYIVLMLLYEAPIVVAALGGLLHAGRRRTPFTDLLLWWALTAFSMYALANEKVPWLLVHIMLPLCLLAGCWLASLQSRLLQSRLWMRVRTRHDERCEPDAALRRVFVAVCGLGATFLLRGVSATSFERAGDRHEPLFYAQTTETFRDALFDGLRETTDNEGGLWIYAGKEWPSVWYLREGAPLRGRSPVELGATPQRAPLRLALLPDEDDWKAAIIEGRVSVAQWREAQERLRGWHLRRADFIIWPRASWSALRPDRFALFWMFRIAPFSTEPASGAASGQPDGFLSEWSSRAVIVATPPRAVNLPPQGLKR